MTKTEATGAQRTIVYHYGLAGELLGETIYASGGAKIGERDYVWLDTLPIAQSERTFSGSTVTSSQLVYLHADQLNTPRLATNGSGTVVGRWDSDAFGVGDADDDPDADTNLVNVRLRFPGQYFDEETGLHYNYYRHYWPHAGRYVQHDPIGLEGGLNPYLYANGNPLRYTDPYGLQITEALRLPGVAEAAAAAARAGAMAPAASGATTAGGLAALGPGAAVAGAGIAGYGIGQVANAGLDSLLTRLTGTTLGVLVYEMCHVDSEEERCRKVLKGCREQCLDTFVNNPSSLPGVGSNTQARQRRCVRECMERNGCFNF